MRSFAVLIIFVTGVLWAGTVTDLLQEELSTATQDQLIHILIKPSGQADLDYINSVAYGMDPDSRRELAVSVLKDFAESAQRPILAELDRFPEGSVEEIRTNWIASVVGCAATPEVIRSIAARDDVEWIAIKTFPNILIEPVEIRETTRDELNLANAWGVDKINAPDVWAMGYEGQGIIVSIVDTGVNYNHIDMHNQMWHDTAAGYHYGWDFADNDDDPMDESGHGTHCAGSVGSNGNAGTSCGVAPQATLMAVRVGTTFGDEQDVWDAFEFSVTNGAHVISTSLGWPQSQNPIRETWREAEESILAAGVIHSIAAGNEAGNPATYGDIRTPGDCPPPWLHPDQTTTGGLSATVTVGSTTSSDDLSSFSSLGYSTWKFDAPWNDYADTSPDIGLIDPDICGPGSDIVSCSYSNPAGYTTMSGTSMATPHLAGCMALLLDVNPYLTPAQVDSILEVTSVDLGATGKDNLYGAGRVDVYQAALAAQAVGTETNTNLAVQGFETVLSSISPNPVNSQASFSLYLPVSGTADVAVFDVSGRTVSAIHTGDIASGSHMFNWNVPEHIGNGMYFVRAATNNGTAVSRMTLIR